MDEEPADCGATTRQKPSWLSERRGERIRKILVENDTALLGENKKAVKGCRDVAMAWFYHKLRETFYQLIARLSHRFAFRIHGIPHLLAMAVEINFQEGSVTP